MANPKVPMVTVNCCTPVCCNHTRKRETTPSDDDYLIRAMNRMRMGIPKRSENSTSNPTEDKSFKEPIPEATFPTKGSLGLNKIQREAIVKCWDDLFSHHAFICKYLLLIFEKQEARKPFMVPEMVP